MKPWLVISILLISASAAVAEPFSIRCEAGQPAQVYYATLDPDLKRAVFESASPINLYSGEIVSVRDDRMEVALKADESRLYFVWDAASKRVLWPGIHGDPFRPTLSHSCRVTPARNILSFREPVEVTNPVSVSCEAFPPGMFFTFDIATAKVLYQRKGGSSYLGRIESAEGDRVLFRLPSDEQRQIAWDRRTNAITVAGIPGDSGRPETVYQCEPIKPRSMLEAYDGRP